MLGEIVEEIVKEKATFERMPSIIDVAGKAWVGSRLVWRASGISYT